MFCVTLSLDNLHLIYVTRVLCKKKKSSLPRVENYFNLETTK